jgi:hypothetical protein
MLFHADPSFLKIKEEVNEDSSSTGSCIEGPSQSPDMETQSREMEINMIRKSFIQIHQVYGDSRQNDMVISTSFVDEAVNLNSTSTDEK